LTIEETIAAIVAREIAPLAQQVRQLATQIEQLRRTLPAPLASVTKAAEVLGVDPRTVRRRVQDGSLPARRVGRKLLVDLGAVMHVPTDEEVDRIVRTIGKTR